MSESDTIQVLVMDDAVRRSDRRGRMVELKVELLAENVGLFLTQMEDVFAKAPEEIGGKFRLSEFTVSAEITAKGGLSLLGTGGEVGGKGALSFRFQRKS
jgi:hypothetical protein